MLKWIFSMHVLQHDVACVRVEKINIVRMTYLDIYDFRSVCIFSFSSDQVVACSIPPLGNQ